MKSLLDWFDSRTGVRKLAQEALYEKVPGGARWRYVWGSTLTFTFMVQVITGLFLWMAYSPSSQTAWESVNYIQDEMWGGWLLRGIHHFTAQAMIVLLVLHLMQVMIDGAYRAPREVNFFFGMILLLLVLALSLTGYLLPWDQKGFGATKVSTNIMGITPFIGTALQKIVIGGVDYGHHTLTRFFALHAGVLPGLVIALITGHVYLFRKHGLTAAEPKRKRDCAFWPDQVLKDAVACLAVLAVVIFFIVKPRLFGDGGLGAELGAPADPSEPFSAARPEWYFLFLYQFLKAEWLVKIFGHHGELVGAIIIPSLVMAILFTMPFLGRWRLGHRFNLGFLAVILGGASWLTLQAVREDSQKPEYVASIRQAGRDAGRVKALARERGIPPAGAVELLRADPLTQGPKLFARNCASCHRYDGHDGLGHKPADSQSASDLKGFASRAWLTGLLEPAKVDSTNYFGATTHREGKMVDFVKKKVTAYDAEKREQLRKALIAVSAEAGLKAQATVEAGETALLAEGRKLMRDTMSCIDCHQYREPDDHATAPDLTGYGSREWLTTFIRNPEHTRFYSETNDRMPAFGENGRLNEQAIGLIADWLRGEWYEPPSAARGD